MALLDARAGSLDFAQTIKSEQSAPKPRAPIDYHGLLLNQVGLIYNGATSTVARIFRGYIGQKPLMSVESPHGVSRKLDDLTGEDTALFIKPVPEQATPLPGLAPCLLEVRCEGQACDPVPEANEFQEIIEF